MENKEFKFATNINCGGCVTAVTPHFDKAEGIREWNVDTAHKDKVLTVTAEGLDREQVLDIVKKAGFKAAPLGE